MEYIENFDCRHPSSGMVRYFGVRENFGMSVIIFMGCLLDILLRKVSSTNRSLLWNARNTEVHVNCGAHGCHFALRTGKSCRQRSSTFQFCSLRPLVIVTSSAENRASTEALDAFDEPPLVQSSFREIFRFLLWPLRSSQPRIEVTKTAEQVLDMLVIQSQRNYLLADPSMFRFFSFRLTMAVPPTYIYVCRENCQLDLKSETDVCTTHL